MTETPIYDALFVEHTIANLTADYWTAAAICGTCEAAGSEPCRTRSGRVAKAWHRGRRRG